MTIKKLFYSTLFKQHRNIEKQEFIKVQTITKIIYDNPVYTEYVTGSSCTYFVILVHGYLPFLLLELH